jgi:hypothetical protein
MQFGSGGPKKARLAMQACKEKAKAAACSDPAGSPGKRMRTELLKNFQIYLMGDFAPDSWLPKSAANELIKLCGGKRLKSFEELQEKVARKKDVAKHRRHIIALGMDEKTAQSDPNANAVQRFADDGLLQILKAEWLTDSISVFQARPVKNYSF